MKTKTQFILLTSALAVLLCGISACKKDVTSNETEVTGIVTEYGTNIPIVGTTVVLQNASVDAFVSYAYSNYLIAKTDVNGKYTLKFTYDNEMKYRIAASNLIYFDSDYYSVKSGSNLINIQQYPPAWLKGHFKNVNPFDSSDRIDGGSGYFSLTFYGSTVDTITNKRFVRGNTTISNIFFITKNGIQTKMIKDIYCPGYDTTTLDINY